MFCMSKLRKFLFLLCFSFVALAWAQPLNVAVSDLDAKGVTSSEASIISGRLRQEMLNTGAFRVMERNQMDAIMKEQSLQQTGACSSEECQVEVGRLLGVDRIVVGSLGKIGSVYSLEVRLLNVETGEVMVSQSVDYDGAVEGLLQGPVRGLALRLSGKEIPPDVLASMKAPPKKSSRLGLRLALGAGALGVGILGVILDQRVKDKNQDLKSIKSQISSGSANPLDRKSIEADYESKKKDADNAAIFRTVSYGVAGACAIGLGLTFAF